MRRQLSDWCLALSVCAFFVGPVAHAQLIGDRPAARVGEVIDTKGDEDFLPPELGDWREATLTQPLINGDLLRTGAFGGLGISFTDRTQMRLHANSRLEVNAANAAGTERKFTLSAGRLWSRASRPDTPLIVETPAATAAIRGTDWFVEVLDDGSSRLVVLDGEVRYFNTLGEVIVGPGVSAIARQGEAPEIELVVASADRPRWALAPRSDWATFLPIAEVLPEADGTPLEAAFAAINQGSISGLRGALPPVPDLANPYDRAARMILLLAERQPKAALDLAVTGPTQPRLRPAGFEETDTRQALLVLASAETDVLPVAGSADSPAIQKLLFVLRAGTLIDLSRLTDAASVLEAYELRFSPDVTSTAMRTYLELYAGRYDQAGQLVETLPAAADSDVRVAMLKSFVAAMTGNDADLDTYTARAITLAPDNSAAWYWRSLYLLTAGGVSYDTVADALDRVVALNPASVNGWTAIGQLRGTAGDLDGALNAFDVALALQPAEPFALSGKSFSHIRQDRLDLAEAVFADVSEANRLHPEIQSALAVIRLMQGQPEAAGEATARLIAANPGRPGATTLDAMAQWHAGRRNLAIKSIFNAIRLDPNDAFSAQAGSVMAQDEYRAGDAIRLARAALDADARSRDAGLIDLPASQSGRIDIGSAFRNLGLSAQGETYSSQAANPFNANTAFAYGGIFPDSLARQSSTSTGLMLDPLSVTFPLRHAQFYRTERNEAALSASVAYGDAGSTSGDVSGQIQGLTRTNGHPLAYAAFMSASASDPARDNNDAGSGLLSLRLGTVRDGRHGFVGRITVDARDQELPGYFTNPDGDDSEDTLNTVVDLGYTRINAWNDRWLVRAAYGHGERDFRNPSALGTNLTDLELSLAVSLGLDVAQDYVSRGLFDTPFSEPNEAILFVNPPATLPVTARLGAGLLPFVDDDDPVRRIRSEADLLSLQLRRMISLGGADLSFGLEYGRIDNATNRFENIFLITGAGAVADFDNDTAITVFDLGSAVSRTERQESSSEMLQAHLQSVWQMSDHWRIETGIFPVLLRSEFKLPGLNIALNSETVSLDPRLGLAWSDAATQIRLVAQRTRSPIGIDTIAPLGALGILPNRDLGVIAESIDSASLRLDREIGNGAFLRLGLEHQELDNATAALTGDRLERSAFFSDKAELTRFEASLEIQTGERSAITGRYFHNSGEITGGAQDGNVLPLIGEDEVSITFNWVDPRFFRAQASVTYIGERFADGDNLLPLDEAYVLSGSISRETRDKTWQVSLTGSAIASDDDPSFTGRKAPAFQIGAALSRRW
ncbi:FecR domain-containing protein [Hyphomonas sp.]|jgi:tetratricopeptide (TPR) repeat protein|uniref:FecR domain-containing protein n=1 Tax=Hyphomonas sp. TaxID=87 RepID=UPI0032ECD53B